jgi:transcriptional regulator with XRE-family HTH domain
MGPLTEYGDGDIKTVVVVKNHAATFGGALRRARQDAGLSLRGLAQRIAYSPGWLSRIENGVARPTSQMAKICDRELSTDGELLALAWHQFTEHERGHTPNQLPRDTAAFVGRAAELDLLDGLLRTAQETSTGMLATVEGAAGAGKTALAVRWGHRAAWLFDDGIVHVDLRGFASDEEPLAPADALAGFLTALGVGAGALPSGTGQRAALWRTLTTHRRMLVILDNAADARQIEPLLPSSPTCAVVVTSRRRLTGLVIRNKAVPVPVRPLPAHEAVAVLRSFTGPIGDRSDHAEHVVAMLAERCGRNPLALRIAGVRLATEPWTVWDLVRQLDDPAVRMDFLDTPREPGLSVPTVLTRTRAELDDLADRLLRLLSVSRSGLTGAAEAAHLAQPVLLVQRSLNDLVDLHLAERTGDGRFVVDDLTAAFAAGLPARSAFAGGLPHIRSA